MGGATMTPTIAGRWRCGICDRPHGLIRDADACCATEKAIEADPMLGDETDRREARMTTELEQARKRIGELQDTVSHGLREYDKLESLFHVVDARAERAEAALGKVANMLGLVQFSTGDDVDQCFICSATEKQGHPPDCAVSEALAAAREVLT